MNTEKFQNEKEQAVNSSVETQDKSWELSKEDKSFFERKSEALNHFAGKLKADRENSNNFSNGAISKIDGRIADLNLDDYNPQEIEEIKQKLSHLEQQKQSVMESGEEGLKKVDAESSDLSIDSKEKSINGIKTEDNKEINQNDQEVLDTPAEKKEEKPLSPGDEVFSNGNFYKIYDIHNMTAEEEQNIWESEKSDRDREFLEKSGRIQFREGSDRFFQEGEKFDEQKKKEIKERGPQIKAIIKGGQEVIDIDSKNIIRIDSEEQREKIVKMQKEEDAAETRAAIFMNKGGVKKMVDKITGQPGKF